MSDETNEKNEIKWVSKTVGLPDSYPCIAGRLSSRGKWIVSIGVHGPDLIHGFWEYWLDFKIPRPPEEVEVFHDLRVETPDHRDFSSED